uniref:Uncharacterized protein n=1 Tax=Astatotilapia calliptera TaxID=8154 RepID=A0AAX7SH56_ASTCA
QFPRCRLPFSRAELNIFSISGTEATHTCAHCVPAAPIPWTVTCHTLYFTAVPVLIHANVTIGLWRREQERGGSCEGG